MSFDYNEPILGRRRTGVTGDEFVLTTNSYQVTPNSIIVLGEVPNRLARVTIPSMTEITEIPDTGLTPTTFFVDYNQGYVHVHASLIGTNKVCTFYGAGAYYINASRVFTNSENGNITQTLDEVVSAASNFIYRNEYNIATTYNKLNIVNYQGASFLYINSTSASGHLPSDSVYWARVSGSIFRGQYSTSVSYNSGDTVSDANNYKIYQSIVGNNLNNSLTDASKWQIQVDVSGIATTLNTTNTNINNAEASRVSTESSRVTSEGNRSSAEISRSNAESTRASSEISRTNQESTRQSQESTRVSQENSRETNTSTAITNLNTAVSNVVHRAAYNASTSYVKNNSVSLNGSTWRCLQSTTGNAPAEGIYWTLEASRGADGAGTVAGITSTNGDIAVAGTPQNPTLTLNSGTGVNQIVKRDGSGNLNATTVTTNANLTGDVTSVGNATSIAPNVIVNADINASAGIDTTKLANGTVTNTEFQYLDGVTSAIQTQITARANEIGILSGLPTTSKTSLVSAITEIWNYPFSNMARQAIVNGNFEVCQKGVIFTNPTNSQYTLDRWQFNINASGGTFPTTIINTQQKLTSGDIFNSYFYDRLNVNGAGSTYGSTAYYFKAQSIENGVTKLCGAGKKVTVSFYARSDIAGKKLGVSCRQSYGSGGSPTATESLTGNNFTLTSSWTKYTVTITTNTIVGKTFGTNNDDSLQLYIWYLWGTTFSEVGTSTAETFAGSGNIDIAQVQVCSGDVALPYQPRSYMEELQLSRRNNYRIKASANFSTFGVGQAISTTSAIITIPLQVAMRVIPTLTTGGSLRLISNTGTTLAVTSITTADSSLDVISLTVGVASGGLTGGDAVLLTASLDANAYLNFDAEF